MLTETNKKSSDTDLHFEQKIFYIQTQIVCYFPLFLNTGWVTNQDDLTVHKVFKYKRNNLMYYECRIFMRE